MKPEILKALNTLKINNVPIEDIKKYLEQEEITDEIKPVLVGHSTRPLGFGGFKTMETGHEIYEFEGKYLMYQESLKNGEKSKVTFYKENFKSIKLMKDEELLTVLILLDDIKKYVEKQSYEGSWYNLNHKLCHNDNQILIEYDWGTYEEGGDYVVTIDLTEKTIRDKDSGSTVYGNFENDNIRKYKNYQDIINFLKEYFAYEN